MKAVSLAARLVAHDHDDHHDHHDHDHHDKHHDRRGHGRPGHGPHRRDAHAATWPAMSRLMRRAALANRDPHVHD